MEQTIEAGKTRVERFIDRRKIGRSLARVALAAGLSFGAAACLPPGSSPPIPPNGGWGCEPALEYLREHAAPEFGLVCDPNLQLYNGGSINHQAETCPKGNLDCPNQNLILIREPCPIAYMNEAENSQIRMGRSSNPLDMYGPSC